MPRPAYPPDWSSMIRGLQTGLRRAYTAAQTRVRYAAIRAASIVVGEANSTTISIDPRPGGGELPRLRFTSPSRVGHADLAATAAGDAEIGSVLNSVRDADNETYIVLTPASAVIGTRVDGTVVARAQIAPARSDLRAIDSAGTLRSVVGAAPNSAAIVAYRANGTIAAALIVEDTGTISWVGSWSPSINSAAAARAEVDQDSGAEVADMPLADQVAALRAEVADMPLADQVAALRAEVDQVRAALDQVRATLAEMPRFRSLSPEEASARLGDLGLDGEEPPP